MNASEIDLSSVIFANGQLSLIGQNATHIPQELADSYGAIVKRLDLSFNCLSKLEGLEAFQKLEELILDNNEIEEICFPDLPYLHTLTLNKNKLKELEQLLDEIEKHLQSLRYLSLLGNEACPDQLSSQDRDEEDYRRYRLYVLYRLPKLKFLDSSAVTEKERKEAQKQGSFLRVVKPSDTLLNSSDTMTSDSNSYSPLPSGTRDEPEHKAIYGKCRYVYYGRHSEGNRFIRNNDL